MTTRKAPHERLRSLIDQRWDGSDESFAAEVPITPGHLSKLVNGHAPLRSSRKLGRIAEVLGVTPDEVLFGSAEGPSAPNVDSAASPGPWADSLIGYLETAMERAELLGFDLGPGDVTKILGGAYATALAHRWPESEMAKLDRWRTDSLRRFSVTPIDREPSERAWDSRPPLPWMATDMAVRAIKARFSVEEMREHVRRAREAGQTEDQVALFVHLAEEKEAEEAAGAWGEMAPAEAAARLDELEARERRYRGRPTTSPPEATGDAASKLEEAGTGELAADEAPPPPSPGKRKPKKKEE